MIPGRGSRVKVCKRSWMNTILFCRREKLRAGPLSFCKRLDPGLRKIHQPTVHQFALEPGQHRPRAAGMHQGGAEKLNPLVALIGWPAVIRSVATRQERPRSGACSSHK